MSKKHFIELADMIRNTRPTSNSEGLTGTFALPGDRTDGRMQQWVFMRDKLADYCAQDNPRFNRSRWLSYIAGECGPNGGAIKGKVS